MAEIQGNGPTAADYAQASANENADEVRKLSFDLRLLRGRVAKLEALAVLDARLRESVRAYLDECEGTADNFEYRQAMSDALEERVTGG